MNDRMTLALLLALAGCTTHATSGKSPQQLQNEIQSIADDITSKYVPPHVNIFYCFGGIVFTLFLVQVATGFAMTFYYRPSVVDAFASVEYIMTEVNFGWLIRSIHRWSASMMVLMLVLHVCRVYLTGGFKKPRELTWVTGVTLAVTTVSFGVTGYSLPWDQVGYWACKIVTGVPEAVPLVGPMSQSFLIKETHPWSPGAAVPGQQVSSWG